MPRRARMYLAGVPYHIVQRGNNREPCFFAVEDYQFYLELLTELLPKYGVALHAYVLMTNHVHLLMTPNDSESISRLTRVLGSRYAFYINKTYKRTGTLWEGRHKSSAVDTENHLLKCYRYIELNPVAANMIERPEEYRWSSYGVNAWGDDSKVVVFHDEYLRLGRSKKERLANYRGLFRASLSGEDLDSIRKAAHYCQPLGDSRFCEKIASRSGVSLGQMNRGRPRF
ncbi:MAG: transposase [Agarilytica sp.]